MKRVISKKASKTMNVEPDMDLMTVLFGNRQADENIPAEEIEAARERLAARKPEPTARELAAESVKDIVFSADPLTNSNAKDAVIYGGASIEEARAYAAEADAKRPAPVVYTAEQAARMRKEVERVASPEGQRQILEQARRNGECDCGHCFDCVAQ